MERAQLTRREFFASIHHEFIVAKGMQGSQQCKVVTMWADDMKIMGIPEKGLLVLKTGANKTVAIAVSGLIEPGTIVMPLSIRESLGVRAGDSIQADSTTKKLKRAKAAIFDVSTDSGNTDTLPDDLSMVCSLFLKEYGENIPVVNGDQFPLRLTGMGIKAVVRVRLPANGIFTIDARTKILVAKKRRVTAGEDSWDIIGGLDAAIAEFKSIIELPLKHAEIFSYYKTRPSRGVLLKGPPGCGKTLLAKVLAKELGVTFKNVTCGELLSQMFGQSEKNIKQLFDDARKCAPTIIFFDEIDALFQNRKESAGSTENRYISELLAQIDGLSDNDQVVIIGATNRPDAIDAAFRRPGRLDREIMIPIPDEKARRQILDIHLQNVP
nr:AAA family ATPase [Candidatus Sigynarchaeota archaeon]